MWVVWKNIFAPRHASRALWHVLKIKKGDIAVCKAVITARYLARYKALYDSSQRQMDSKKRASKCIEKSVASLQEAAVGTLLKRRGIPVSDYSVPISSVTPFSLALGGGSMPGVASVRGSR